MKPALLDPAPCINRHAVFNCHAVAQEIDLRRWVPTMGRRSWQHTRGGRPPSLSRWECSLFFHSCAMGWHNIVAMPRHQVYACSFCQADEMIHYGRGICLQPGRSEDCSDGTIPRNKWTTLVKLAWLEHSNRSMCISHVGRDIAMYRRSCYMAGSSREQLRGDDPWGGPWQANKPDNSVSIREGRRSSGFGVCWCHVV